MKKIFLSGICFISLQMAAFSQTLFTYGKNKVETDEFLRAYQKNNSTETNKEKALLEYVDLYINFKLKVQDAKSKGLDTLPQIIEDVANFRNQIIESYLAKPDAIEALEKEALARSGKDILVQHFYVPFAINGSDESNNKATEAAEYIYNNLTKNKTDYTKLAEEASQKYTAVNTSNLGYLTAFTLPYNFENIIYGLPANGVNKPYASKKGLHVFKVLNIRQSAGRWRVAQILFSYPPQADEATKADLKEKANTVYNLLKTGTNFTEAVKKYSTDRLTLNSDGEMPEFGTGKYSGKFEDAVFALKKDGDFTAPFETTLGFHIVKRLRNLPITDTTSNEVLLLELKQKVLADTRINSIKEDFNKEVLQQTGFKIDKNIAQNLLLSYVETLKNLKPQEATPVYTIANSTIANIKQQPVKGSEWIEFARMFINNSALNQNQSATQIWDAFVLNQSVAYYREHLEDFNPAFKYQMQEFKEGNMLFEIMERKVWNKAIEDSTGALALYNANKQNYTWQKSADVIVFNASNKEEAQKILDQLSKNKTWKEIILEADGLVQADSSRYELNQITISDPNFVIKKGAITPMIIGEDGTAAFVKFIKLYNENEPRSFDDARGLVINDYQAILEKEWIQDLKKAYPVKLNKKVLDKVISQQ